MNLYPYKVLDPVHGFIRFDDLEQRVIDTLFFQRLRYIRQMGVSYLVYPGANHSRFEHSLGVMELAGRIFDSLTSPQNQVIDLHLSKDELSYWKRIVRLASLCHDMGHLPFSHTAEKILLKESGHEGMTLKILQSEEMQFINKELGERALDDLIKLSLGEEKISFFLPDLVMTATDSLFAKIITEDNFGADRIDYLIRDAKFTGVAYGHFDYYQLIDTMRILPEQDGNFTLGVIESGMQSVESLWIARYLMYARVYKHPKVCLYSAHMKRYMAKTPFSTELNGYISQNDCTLLEKMAKSEDEDALILLKKSPPYCPILLTKNNQEFLEKNKIAFEKTFGSDVMIEWDKRGGGSRTFWVYSGDAQLISSEEYSDFLKNIPLGVKPLQLFVRPNVMHQVKDFLQVQP